MAFTDKSPASWLGAGYNGATGKIEINTNSAATNKLLTELTDAEADEINGDIRKLLFGIFDGLFVKFRTKNDSLAEDDRPQRMVFTRSTFVNEATGVITRSYTAQFQLAASAIEVLDEPV